MMNGGNQEMTTTYIAAAYAVISLVLMMTRKYKRRFILLVPAACQIGSVLLLNKIGFNVSMTAAAVIINLIILLAVDVFEKKQMKQELSGYSAGADVTKEVQQQNAYEAGDDFGSFRQSSNADDYSSGDWKGGVTGELPVMREFPAPDEPEIKRPEVENKPINEVAPVQQEIFDASNNEIKEMIANMLENGDITDAKRYLRMLAFFAKDENSRKMAEEKLAEINAMAQ